MKKIIIILLAILISGFCLYAYADTTTIINADHVDYPESSTNQTDVKTALDELIDKVDAINQGGDATEEDIAAGKSAYVKGKLVTGTKKDRPTYWRRSSINEVYLDGKQLSTYTVNAGVPRELGDKLYIRWGETAPVNVYTCTNTQAITFNDLIQVSSDVIAIHWGIQTIATETSSYTDTVESYTYAYNNLNYITTYIITNGVLTKVAQTTVSIGGGDTKNYLAFVQDYDSSNINLTTDVTTTRKRKTTSKFSESTLANLDKNFIYYRAYGFYTDEYYHSAKPNDCYTTRGYWYRTLSINVYTGAQALSKIVQATSIYYSKRETPVYNNTYDYDFTAYGLKRNTYTDNYHNTYKNTLYYDFYGTTYVASITSDGTDKADLVRNNPYVLKADNLYGFDIGYSYTSDNRISLTLYSSRLGNNTTVAAYYLANPVVRSKSLNFNISYLLPEGVTLRSEDRIIYSSELKELYLTFNCNIGRVYIILGFDKNEDEKSEILSFSLKSVAYREREDGEKLPNRIRLSSFKVLDFYK